MRRWTLFLIGALLIAVPFILGPVKPFVTSGTGEWEGIPSGLPAWLRVSIMAGAYLVEWGPALAGLLIILYANRTER